MTPHGEHGASAVEYGLIVSAVAGLIAAIVFLLGTVLDGSYQDSCDKLRTEFEATVSTC